MSYSKVGNHALAGSIARLLETAKLDGFLNGLERAKLTGLMAELTGRYDRALTALPPAPPTTVQDGTIPATTADKEDD